jgi:SAM-dependent methyltransferase
VREALTPFLAPGSDERWRKEAALRRRRLIGRLAKRLIGKGERGTEQVREEYDAAWSVGYDRYDLASRTAKYTPWVWDHERLLFDAAGAPRFRCLLYAAVIEKLKPRSVLEIGCGDGINLLMLSGAFPEVAFAGLELTDTGHSTAMQAKASPALPQALMNYSPLPLTDALAFRRIDFIQGNACQIPLPANHFDLVLTALAIEQMERVRATALAEMARVAARHALNLEPFRDVNATGLRRLNVLSRDYFRGSIAELRKYGLTPRWGSADFPQEVLLGAALVLSDKST